jgi:hypothetical protein
MFVASKNPLRIKQSKALFSVETLLVGSAKGGD